MESLSVVIPNYNHGQFITDAVEAAASQIPCPSEIIVVDDGSTDDSLVVLHRLRSRYPNLKVQARDTNGGAIAALNAGLSAAKGTYVYFGAADDVTRPGLFAATLAMAARHPDAALVCAEGEVLDMSSGQTSMRPPVRPAAGPRHFSAPEVARLFQRIDNWILTGASIVRRDLLLEVGGFDGELGAMADGYALRRLAFLHGCCFVPITGMTWRVHAEGLSRTQAADPQAGMQALATALAKMRADPAFPPWYPAVFERRWRFALSRLALKSEPVNAAVINALCATTPLTRRIVSRATLHGGAPGRFVALAWLAARQRPTSFSGLAATWLARRVQRLTTRGEG